MSKQLYRRYDVDEETPVQFVGVYTTHWRSEWGKPEVMFAQVDDPLIENAAQLLKACELALIGFERIGGWGPPEFANPYSEVMVRLRAAIAAAKGEHHE